MALDDTAREANVRDSVHKFLLDNLETIEGYKLVFGNLFAYPKVAGSDVEKWICVDFRDFSMSTVSVAIINLNLFARKDDEGFKLSQMRDTVTGYLVDYDMPDGIRRIPFYKSHPTEEWTLLPGGLMALIKNESGIGDAEDNTRHRFITIQLMWGSK